MCETVIVTRNYHNMHFGNKMAKVQKIDLLRL